MNQHNSFQAPFICNIEFTAPSRFQKENEKIVQRNVNHIQYIATREGVEVEKETQQVKALVKDEDELDLEKYLNYISDRPGSHGLFSQNDNPNLKAIKEELAEHRGVVWRVVLSLTENDAKKLGYSNREAWETALRATVPEAMSKMRIGETNLRWVAAFHNEKDHPHVHLVCWENKPKRRRGRLSPHELTNVKKVFHNIVFAEERKNLFLQKNMARDLLRDLSQRELIDTVSFVREIKHFEKQIELEQQSRGSGNVPITPKLHNEDAKKFVTDLKELGEMMPNTGRIAFKYMPQEVKEMVVKTTHSLLAQPVFRGTLHQYYDSVKQLTQHYSFKESDLVKALDNAKKDVEKRLSQVILKAAAETKKINLLQINDEKANQFLQKFKQAIGAPVDDLAFRVIQKTSEVLLAAGFKEEQQKLIFASWTKQASLQLSTEQIHDVIARVNRSPVQELKNPNSLAHILKLSGINQKNIERVLQDKGIATESINQILKNVQENDGAAANVIKAVDWERLNKSLGTSSQYPWKYSEESNFNEEVKAEISKEFKVARLTDDLEPYEKQYIAYCMTVALKELNFTTTEINQIITEFSANNDIDSNRFIPKVLDAETYTLKESTWNRICEATNLKIDYPWKTDYAITLDENLYKQAIDIFQSSKGIADDELQWAVNRINEFFKQRHNEHEAKAMVQQILDLKGQIVNIGEPVELRERDIEILSKKLFVTDHVQQTVRNLVHVLSAAGVSDITNQILDWNVRSGANIEKERLVKIIEQTQKQINEIRTWGRVPVISKKSFGQLTETLNIKSNYVWEGDKKAFRQSPLYNLTKQLWKGFWQVIEQERMRVHAQGQQLKERELKRLQRAKQRSNENEQ